MAKKNKMQVLILCFGLIFSSRCAAGDYESLAGHQVWKLNGKESAVPAQLMIDGLLDVLDHSGHLQKVRVAPHHAEKVRRELRRQGITYEVLVDDLASHLEAFDKSDRVRRDVSENKESCVEESCPNILTKSYMTFVQMEWYLKEFNKTHYPRVTLSSIGKSHEDRDIWLLHIKSDNSSAKSVWVEGGIHAREWISPAVSLGLIPKLVDDENLKENFDFFVAPMANPDGYHYSWTTNRLWRKNRRNNGQGDYCDGVDLNRNWDYKFGVGASSTKCSEVYKGPLPFSEPETKALKDAMVKEKDNLLMVFSLHSYGQDLLYPWGWNHTVDAPNKDELIRVGKLFSDGAKESYGSEYDVVNSAGGLYYASGATDDWALGELDTKYVYTLELRDNGSEGFQLSTDAIEPSIEEVWRGFKKAVSNIVQ